MWKKADEIEGTTKSDIQAVLETFDGLRLTVETKKKDETTFGKIMAAFDPAPVYKEEKSPSSEKEKKGGEETDQSKDGKPSDVEKDSETEDKKPGSNQVYTQV